MQRASEKARNPPETSPQAGEKYYYYYSVVNLGVVVVLLLYLIFFLCFFLFTVLEPGVSPSAIAAPIRGAQLG